MSPVRERAWSLAAPLLFGAGAIGARVAGFSAISDDDFARVTIAQTFAHAPKLDPSGSSWLPFPFWWQGAVHALVGRSLVVAEACAVAAAIAAGVLFDRSCRLLGGSVFERVLIALLLLSLPSTVFLAAATVPELLTAGLVCYGLAAIAVGDDREATLGGAALLAATLSRYETWPMALVAACFALGRARRERTAVLAGFLACAGPVLWLAWSGHAHGDALWPLRRVAAFRAHAGGGPGLLAGYPLALLRHGVPSLVMAVVAFRLRGTWLARGSAPLAIAGAASFAFLLVGDVLGGAPTHHPERALLPVFATLLLATTSGAGLAQHARQGAGVGAVALLVWAVQVSKVRASFVDRRAAIDEGRLLAQLVPPGQRIIVARDTYATEASRAAFGRAEDLIPVLSHRFDARSTDEPFVSPAALREAARRRGATYVVVGAAHLDLGRAIGEVVSPLTDGALVKLID